jgi:hypothetical protein
MTRQLLLDSGIRLPKGEQIHMKAVLCLRGCGDPLAAKTADELEALRSQRNRADYEIDGPAIGRELAASQVHTAKKIAAELEQCRSGPGRSDFRAKIRAKAKLLGLPSSE